MAQKLTQPPNAQLDISNSGWTRWFQTLFETVRELVTGVSALQTTVPTKLTGTAGESAPMVAGTVTIVLPAVTATSKIICSRRGAVGGAGAVFESARVVGASVTFTSTNPADTGRVAWILSE